MMHILRVLNTNLTCPNLIWGHLHGIINEYLILNNSLDPIEARAPFSLLKLI